MTDAAQPGDQNLQSGGVVFEAGYEHHGSDAKCDRLYSPSTLTSIIWLYMPQ